MTADAVGGVWDYALELARGLAAAGVSTAMAVTGDPPDTTKRAAAMSIPGLILDAAPFKLEWMADPDDDLRRTGDWLLELERRLRPALIHVNGYAHAALPFRAPVLCVAHSCVLSWWRAVHGTDPPPAWRRYAERVADGLRLADRVVAPTRAMLDALETHYGPIPRGTVIHNGRDPAGRADADKRHLFLAAGRLWDEAKNIAAVDAIAARVPWPVFVAGDTGGPDGNHTPLAHACPLGRLATDEMRDWYGQAAVFVHPARYEPFGLAPLEAALAGCALVLGDIPSLRELWDGAADFVPPGDTTALGDALRRLAADSDRCSHLGAAARERAGRYSAGRMVRAYLDLYADMAGLGT
ncbi:glycosyltransferase family 4 protein [Azospirillum sp. RWY-5-1]|uniref:Glycosyltransferase family 4 protein n=2 Tax=Azospirillum oleiclasticum TaxID=2735135 RepID=A0ABX2T4L9_9PROT|nr:glycosyltransferase family 4 protein [Azospirillum oleiclasticum]NYZ19274.1 glycosyltransferase family 4 protein [Azospirillum oleiclasticum]